MVRDPSVNIAHKSDGNTIFKFATESSWEVIGNTKNQDSKSILARSEPTGRLRREKRVFPGLVDCLE